MITYECDQQFVYPADEVFAEGIRQKTWPEVDGLVLKPDDETIALGGIVRVGLCLPHMPGIGVRGEVTEFEEDSLVVIEGKSWSAETRVAFDLTPKKKGLHTNVNYSLAVGLKRLTRIAEPTVRQYLIEEAVPEFATGYAENIINAIKSNRAAQKKAS